MVKPLKIIWNITSKCGYTCDICATYSDRKELNLNEKESTLQSILSIGENNICEIDFAGGDPLYDAESTEIVKKAILALGKDKISVTTTGRGVSRALDRGENLSTLLKNCEITIDALEITEQYLRKDSSYVQTNMDMLDTIIPCTENITINIPIVNPQMTDLEISNLVKAIENISIKNKMVNLIRIMNVGRMAYKPSVFPEHLYQHFIKRFMAFAEINNQFKVHIHCALRGCFFNDTCHMLENKIGIDCAGNAFSCAWGGYLKGYSASEIATNPFYLGNVKDNDLSEVLQGERAREMRNAIQEMPTNYCRVWCFEPSNPNSIYTGVDPLFKTWK